MTQKLDELFPKVIYFVDRKSMPTWHLDEAQINFHDLTYVYKGEATYIVDGIPYYLKAGDIIYIPKNSRRQTYTNQENPMSCYAFNFICHIGAEEYLRLPLPAIIHTGMSEDLIILYKDFNKLWLEQNEGYLIKGRAIFMLILHKLLYKYAVLNSGIVLDKRIEKVKKYILIHFNEKIEIKILAELCNLNTIYFGAFFKKKQGCSVNEYINRIRINNAEGLLSTGGYTVSEVAYKCGFEDIFYFSKLFKRINGAAPSTIFKY